MRRKFLKLICISLLGVILVPHRYLYSQTKKIINQNLTKEQKDILFNEGTELCKSNISLIAKVSISSI